MASELEAAQQLAGRLEEDLVLAQRQVAASGSGPAEQGPDGGPGAGPDPGAAAGGGREGEAPSMLAVMSGQRDRFRARVRELEEHLLVQTQQLARVGACGAARAWFDWMHAGGGAVLPADWLGRTRVCGARMTAMHRLHPRRP